MRGGKTQKRYKWVLGEGMGNNTPHFGLQSNNAQLCPIVFSAVVIEERGNPNAKRKEERRGIFSFNRIALGYVTARAKYGIARIINSTKRKIIIKDFPINDILLDCGFSSRKIICVVNPAFFY